MNTTQQKVALTLVCEWDLSEQSLHSILECAQEIVDMARGTSTIVTANVGPLSGMIDIS